MPLLVPRALAARAPASRPSRGASAPRRATIAPARLARDAAPRRGVSLRRRAEGADAADAPPPQAAPAAPAPAPPPPAAAAPANPDADAIAAAVADIKDYLKLLYVKREMNFNEVKLTLAIEDPRLADRRERYGIEDESGVSADEKVAALEAIDAGEMPTDLLAVEKLLEDFREWPGLEDAAGPTKSQGPSRYAEIANQAAGIKGQPARDQKSAGGEEEEEMDGNPFGFLVLYGVSAVPIFITIAALSIMFVNSLQ